jgi:hypothetical protein
VTSRNLKEETLARREKVRLVSFTSNAARYTGMHGTVHRNLKSQHGITSDLLKHFMLVICSVIQ